MPEHYKPEFVGILLAAGRGFRFDPTGEKNKLLQPLSGGDLVAIASAKNLLSALPRVVAVVRPGATELASQLGAVGCEITECAAAEHGMSQSLIQGIAMTADATGWVVALADMPFVRPKTIAQLATSVETGADIAVPAYQGRRGNPVAFSPLHMQRLLQLQGDQGARSLLKSFPVTEVDVDDPGVLRDIDAVSDLTPT
jgi:molybdenum cofactor cytidylyltransferase